MSDIIEGSEKVIIDACFKAGYKQGRADAFHEMIDKCKKYNYICHSSEFAKVLEEWMNEKGEE